MAASGVETFLYTMLTFAGLNGALILILVAAVSGHLAFLWVRARGSVSWLDRPAPGYLLLNLTLANLLVVVASLVPSLVATFAQRWPMGAAFCQASAYCTSLGVSNAAHTLGLLALERYLRVCRPLGHAEALNRVTVKLLLAGLWFFDAVLSAFPLLGWGEYGYTPAEYQCWTTVAGWQRSFSHLNFSVVLWLAMPLGLAVLCLGLVARRVRGLLQTEEEERGRVVVESYGYKLLRLQQRMTREIGKAKGGKKPKKKIQKKAKKSAKRRARDSGHASSSEDEAGVPEGHRKYVQAHREQRLCGYSPQEVGVARLVVWLWVAFLACWLPYLVLAYLRVWESPGAQTSALVRSLTWLSHCSLAINPLIYLVGNKRLRQAFLSPLTPKKRIRPKKAKKKKPSSSSSSSSSSSEDEPRPGHGSQRAPTGSQVTTNSQAIDGHDRPMR